MGWTAKRGGKTKILTIVAKTTKKMETDPGRNSKTKKKKRTKQTTKPHLIKSMNRPSKSNRHTQVQSPLLNLPT